MDHLGNNSSKTTSMLSNNIPLAAQNTTATVRTITVPICPDLLDYSAIGAADGFRGKLIRLFFFVMKLWPVSAKRLHY